VETGAPYLRIVTAIKDRIARGELGPGEKIPSTRQITRDWGVAMATATKVITTLRDEGVVDTKPGAGTVVRATQSAPAVRKTAHELSRERIVRAAIEIADAEGLAVLSMRRVATDLGVATMSLYRHVSSKDELTVYMADAVFAEEPLPQQMPPGWRERLATPVRHMWTTCRRHPWAGEVMSMSRPQVMPNAMAMSEWTLATLRELGLPVEEMMDIHLNLFGHARGLAATLAAEMQARQDTGIDNEEWLDTQGELLQEILVTGRYPAMEYMTGQGYAYDLDRLFEFGLKLMLDGVQLRLREAGQRGGQ
jgi:DNA-binding transcriptional regulator YhcF (GntR family)